jgi:hypothetical protein
MNYSKEFYAINLRFAVRAHQVSQLPLRQVLLEYTNLYVRLGLGHSMDSSHPTWQRYLDGLEKAEDPAAWTAQFAADRADVDERAGDSASFGCFSYTIWDDKRLRIHFHNQESEDISPLSDARLPARQAELKRMFSYVKQNNLDIKTVVGGSWLYHLPAYRRIFPPAFITTARPGGKDYQYLVLWGQFVDRHGQVRPEPARQFIACLENKNTMDGILNCFPLKVLYLDAPVGVFFTYYSITHNNG